MTDSREKFCVRACEGIGTGELAAIIEGGTTLKQQFQGVVEQRDDALAAIRRVRTRLQYVHGQISTSCCGTVVDKAEVLSDLDKVLKELDKY